VLLLPLTVKLVEEGEDFGDGVVESRRNACIQIELHEQLDKGGVMMDRHARFSRGGNDPFGNHAVALRRHARRGITVRRVFERHGARAHIPWMVLRH